mmetsp:Transcript_26477/g.40154  ORF Transcript_26477/g.40154 Transcript_26477/m.40154 type:complete len:211 (+) Transcript_26477:3078-3710(+)
MINQNQLLCLHKPLQRAQLINQPFLLSKPSGKLLPRPIHQLIHQLLLLLTHQPCLQLQRQPRAPLMSLHFHQLSFPPILLRIHQRLLLRLHLLMPQRLHRLMRQLMLQQMHLRLHLLMHLRLHRLMPQQMHQLTPQQMLQQMHLYLPQHSLLLPLIRSAQHNHYVKVISGISLVAGLGAVFLKHTQRSTLQTLLRGMITPPRCWSQVTFS